MSRVKRLHFHGPLKKLCPEPVEFICDTVAEAIEAISKQIPAFKSRPKVSVVGFETVDSLYKTTDIEDIHITPALVFGKKRGLVQTVIGAVLIAASILMPGLPTWAATALFMAGVSLTTGGIVQMLTPVPTVDTVQSEEEERSKYLGTPRNTTRIGTPIPILYGKRRVGGHILSFNIDATDTGY